MRRNAATARVGTTPRRRTNRSPKHCGRSKRIASFSERRVIVTGAGSGKGKAIVELLLERGAEVALLDISPDSLKETVGRFNAALAIAADVADEGSVNHAMAQIRESFADVDLMVNNAGIVRSSRFDDLPLKEWSEVFAVNSTGAFLTSKAAMPLLREAARRRGDSATAAVVNITSVEVHFSSQGFPRVHYNASKGALLQLTRALAVDATKHRVRVNAVAPGFIETPFTKATLDDPLVKSWLLERTPMGRIGRTEDVAEAVASCVATQRAGSPAPRCWWTVDGRSCDQHDDGGRAGFQRLVATSQPRPALDARL